MGRLIQDLRYALRTLRKTPGSTAIAITVLALGIGVNSAIFSAVSAVLLRPPPYKDADRLVVVWTTKLSQGMRQQRVSPGDYRDFRDGNQVFDQIGALHTQTSVLATGELPERIETAVVSPSLLTLLGIQTELGRTFAPEEDHPGRNHVAILTAGLWRRHFGASRNILGQTVVLDGASYTVIGVAAPGSSLPAGRSELWIPYVPDPKYFDPSYRGYRFLNVIAHLKPGVSIEQAESATRIVADRLAQTYPVYNGGYSVELMPLREQLVGDIRFTLWTLLATVAAVLLIACGNVAHLQLARATGRQREMAVRIALGANPGRLVVQLLTESVLLALLAGVAGLLLGYWTMPLLVKLLPSNAALDAGVSLDWRVLAFTLCLSVITGVLFGLAPAVTAVRTNLNVALRSGGRGGAGYRAQSRLRDAVMVCEMASCAVLLICAGLLIRSFARLQAVNPGFRPDHILTLELSLPQSRYPGIQVGLFYQRLIDRVQALAEVDVAGVSRYLPLGGSDASLNFRIESQPVLSSADQPRAKFRSTSGGYFAALGIPLQRGRVFTNSDDVHTPKVAVINETAARRYWPNDNPIGKRILSGLEEDQWTTIVGVVGDVKHAGLDAEVNPEVYYHYLQIPPDAMNYAESTMSLVIRTRTDPAAMTSTVERELRMLDPGQPVSNVETMEDIVQGSVAQPRFRTLLLSGFAALALLLAALGLYGVMSYSVAQRTAELGIRIALGAEPGGILRLVVGHAARLAAIALGIGVAIGLLVARVMTRFLFGISALDPLTFLGACLVIVAVALLASALPAWRAAQVDPAIVLRAE